MPEEVKNGFYYKGEKLSNCVLTRTSATIETDLAEIEADGKTNIVSKNRVITLNIDNETTDLAANGFKINSSDTGLTAIKNNNTESFLGFKYKNKEIFINKKDCAVPDTRHALWVAKDNEIVDQNDTTRRITFPIKIKLENRKLYVMSKDESIKYETDYDASNLYIIYSTSGDGKFEKPYYSYCSSYEYYYLYGTRGGTSGESYIVNNNNITLDSIDDIQNAATISLINNKNKGTCGFFRGSYEQNSLYDNIIYRNFNVSYTSIKLFPNDTIIFNNFKINNPFVEYSYTKDMPAYSNNVFIYTGEGGSSSLNKWSIGNGASPTVGICNLRFSTNNKYNTLERTVEKLFNIEYTKTGNYFNDTDGNFVYEFTASTMTSKTISIREKEFDPENKLQSFAALFESNVSSSVNNKNAPSITLKYTDNKPSRYESNGGTLSITAPGTINITNYNSNSIKFIFSIKITRSYSIRYETYTGYNIGSYPPVTSETVNNSGFIIPHPSICKTFSFFMLFFIIKRCLC